MAISSGDGDKHARAVKYRRARSMEEAVKAISSGASPIGGGSFLVPFLAHTGMSGDFVDIGRLPELGQITREDGGGLRIGAMVRNETIATAPEIADDYRILALGARVIGNPQVRAGGTIGGNVACRLARACLPAPLVVLEAAVEVCGAEGTSLVPIDKILHEGLPPETFITGVRLPPPTARRSGYVKFEWRRVTAKGIAIVTLSLDLTDGKARSPKIVAAGLCIARRLPKAEAALEGRPLDEAVIEEVARVASAEPPYEVEDIPAGEPYRRRLVGAGVTQILREVAAS